MMRVLVFTCARDREKAALATRTVPPSWSVAWVLDEPDRNLPAPPGVDKVVAGFNRGANLTGPAVCWWISKLLAEHSKPTGRVAKLDSDTLLVDTGFLLKGELAGISHQNGNGAAYGCCYSMIKPVAEEAHRKIEEAIRQERFPQAEDLAITTAPRAKRSLADQGQLWHTPHSGSLPPAGTLAIHCGAGPYVTKASPATAREMARLGDALGLWRRP